MQDSSSHTVPAQSMSDEVAELQAGARVARVTADMPDDLAIAVSELLETAAARLEAHPKAVGGMTQCSLRIARVLNGQAQS